MLIPFEPRFTITPRVVNALIRIKAVCRSMAHLPITPLVLKAQDLTLNTYASPTSPKG